MICAVYEGAMVNYEADYLNLLVCMGKIELSVNHWCLYKTNIAKFFLWSWVMKHCRASQSLSS